MVMKICPKWKMDSAAELAVKNWYVQNKSKNDPLTGSRYLGGPISDFADVGIKCLRASASINLPAVCAGRRRAPKISAPPPPPWPIPTAISAEASCTSLTLDLPEPQIYRIFKIVVGFYRADWG